MIDVSKGNSHARLLIRYLLTSISEKNLYEN